MSRPESLEQWSHDRFIAALSDLLTDQGVVDANGLERARALAGESGARLDAVLTQLGLVSERALAESMGKLLGLDVAGPADYPDQAILPERLRLKFLRKSRAVPLAINDAVLTVAMADPLDHFTVSSMAVAANRHVHVRVAVPIDLEAALERLYKLQEGPVAAAEDAASQSAHVEDDAERLKDLASEAPLIRLVNLLISQAVESRASDIHIDPFEDRLRIRYRFDGVLHEVDAPSRRLHPAIISRIKIMSSLDIAERRLPQDGRIKLVVRGQEVDLRVSTIPSLHGESVVLRILDRSAATLDFTQLGIEPGLQARFCHQIEKPNGIMLVTGPTGSGKTTTLYTALLHLNTAERNIITVEDPVEYQLSGITQIQAKPQIGLNFAAMLRSVLRHDPDVIMVGEIRDLETAQIAMQAALTGHLVLSTLHTNSAAATIARLRDMGVEDYLLTATLNGIMAQRLLRRLCRACRRPVPVTADLAERYGLGHDALDGGDVIYEAGGCPQCRGTGYSGRIAVAELIVPDDILHDLILSRASHVDIQNAAAASGMTTMYENGLRQVLAGTTSLSEVLRSVRMDG
jgi:general secretion pathway protein E